MEEGATGAVFCILYGMCCAAFFFLIRYTMKNMLNFSEIIAVTAVAVTHHIIVVLYSLVLNSSYMSILQEGIQFNTTDCSPLFHSNDQVYYSGIFAIVYLTIDSYYGIIAPATDGVPLNWLMLFHHVNGVVLIACSLYARHGLYMVWNTLFLYNIVRYFIMVSFYT